MVVVMVVMMVVMMVMVMIPCLAKEKDCFDAGRWGPSYSTLCQDTSRPSRSVS